MKEDYSINKYLRVLFYILVITVFVGFICAQFIYPDERNHEIIPDDLFYEGTLFWEKSDGSQEQIVAPGNYEIQPGQVMAITTTLPEDYNENSIAIRGSQQNVRFYIEGELRAEYDTKDSRPFGSESASRYVFCKTSSADAGKELRIELQSGSKRYSGVVNDIFCGNKADIWAYIFSIYGGETIIGMFLLFTGIIAVIFSIAIGIAYHSKVNLEYLGWCMILGAAWMLGESKFRQMIVPNASVLANLCFVVVMLCPVAILIYVDSVQHGRYRKLFGVIGCAAILNLVISSILQFAEIADYLDMLSVSHIILISTFLAVLGSFFLDFCKGRIKEYVLIVIGILLAMVGALVETVSVYFVTYTSGFFLGAGLLTLLFLLLSRR